MSKPRVYLIKFKNSETIEIYGKTGKISKQLINRPDLHISNMENEMTETNFDGWNREVNRQLALIIPRLCEIIGKDVTKWGIFIILKKLNDNKCLVGVWGGSHYEIGNYLTLSFDSKIENILKLKAFW